MIILALLTVGQMAIAQKIDQRLTRLVQVAVARVDPLVPEGRALVESTIRHRPVLGAVHIVMAGILPFVSEG